MKKYKGNNRELAMISENLLSLYNSGIPFLTIFELMEELKLSKGYKESIRSIKGCINEGMSLEESFKRYNHLYPPFFISMIDIGEKTGRLNDILNGITLYFNKLYQINNALKSALTYPIILIISAIGMMLFLLMTVVPSFGEIYSSMGKEIPFICNTVIEISTYVKENTVMTMIYLLSWGVMIPITIYLLLIKDMAKNCFYKVPLFREVTEYVSIMLLSIVVKSGINLSLGLHFCSTSKVFNNIQHEFSNINNKIMIGKTLSEAMKETGIFSKYTLVHVKLGEESGGLENRLVSLEGEIFSKIISKINKSLQMIGPILIIIIGAVVLLFILIFILPLFDVMMGGVSI